jgi:hypothetical protein
VSGPMPRKHLVLSSLYSYWAVFSSTAPSLLELQQGCVCHSEPAPDKVHVAKATPGLSAGGQGIVYEA